MKNWEKEFLELDTELLIINLEHFIDRLGVVVTKENVGLTTDDQNDLERIIAKIQDVMSLDKER
jgi:hypothetical protein